ncbi:MAG: hypothetical protein NC453_22705, partial [Muribaculum sp.]|nr:hypothetical protein [Muribaculum sp.]
MVKPSKIYRSVNHENWNCHHRKANVWVGIRQWRPGGMNGDRHILSPRVVQLQRKSGATACPRASLKFVMSFR